MIPTSASNNSSSNNNNNNDTTIAASPHWSSFITQTKNVTTSIVVENTPGGTEYQRRVRHEDEDDTTTKFTPFVAFCFTLNYVVGTGFLTVPWSFTQSGLLLSIILMIVSTILSDVAKDYLLIAMARAEAMLDSTLHWKQPSSYEQATSGIVPTDFILQKRSQQRKVDGNNTDDDDDDNEEDGTPKLKRYLKPKLKTSQSIPVTSSSSSTGHNTTTHNHNDDEVIDCETPLVSASSNPTTNGTITTTATSIPEYEKLLQNSNENTTSAGDGSDITDGQPINVSNSSGGNDKSGAPNAAVILRSYHSFSKLPITQDPVEISRIQKQLQSPNRQKYMNNLRTILNNTNDDDNTKHPTTATRNLQALSKEQRQNYAGTYLYQVEDRKFEVNALCRIFLGKRGVHIFTIFISLYMCGTLCAYTNVFASAMSKTYDITTTNNSWIGEYITDDSYLVYTIIFALFVVPMSCLELHEQITVQVLMTIGRFIMLFLMISTSPYCASRMIDANTIDDDTDSETLVETIFGFKVTGIVRTLPILVMASVFHHSIPGLSHPVADKTKLGTTIFRSTILCTGIMYTILGIVVVVTFGTHTEQSANLNWNNQCINPLLLQQQQHQSDTIGNDDNDNRYLLSTTVGSESPYYSSWIFQLVSYYIVLFPVIDVLSAFPLNAITLGNNMFGAVYGRNIHQVEGNRWIRTSFRLLASIPPIIISMFVRELGVITDYTGTAGFVIGLTIPALLFSESTKIAKRKHFSLLTYYSSYGANTKIASFVTWSGICMVLIVFISLTFLK